MTTALYIIEQSRFPGGDIGGSLIAADSDGEAIYSHISSNRTWLERDLTRSFGREGELKARYPDGYEVTYVSLDDPVPDAIAHLFRPTADPAVDPDSDG